MSIREALPSEHEAISQLAFKSKASNGYSPSFMEACRAELTYSEAQIRSERYHFMVAEERKAVVGFIALEEVTKNECSIEALFVEPNQKGRGIGRLLLQKGLEWAVSNHFASMHIQSDPGATAFYEASGAQQVGTTPSGSIPGRVLPHLIIDLTLRSHLSSS